MVERLQTRSEPGTDRGNGGEAAAAQAITPGSFAANAPPPADPVEGYIDDVQDRRVFGWAWCRSRPNDPVDVEIRIDDRTVAAVAADRYRPDLAKTGMSEGRHGFEAVLDGALSAEHKARLTAHARSRAGEPWMPLVNRTVRAAAKTADPAEGSASPSRPSGDAQAVLGAIAALEKAVAQGFGRCRADLHTAIASEAAAQAAASRAAAEADRERERWREQWSSLTGSMDVLQTRVDAICAALREEGATSASSRRADRVLMLLVSGLGIVSGASLLLGLIAVFG